jgi:hypothetical protein
MEMVVGDAEARLAAVKDSYDAEVAALRALVRSLAADARRLDWLDANKPNVMGGGRVSLFRSDEFGASTAHAVGATFREAIDAAMAAANARALADAFPVPEVPNA